MGIIKKLITWSYSVRMALSNLTGIGIKVASPDEKVLSISSFYDLTAIGNDGIIIKFDRFKGKKVLLVNLASQCGYTPQYADLQKLHNTHADRLTILGFPSNDFGDQEPGSDPEIAKFCKINYGVTFQLIKKGSVEGPNKQEVYRWLCDPLLNGWNNQAPNWNFCKYLVDERGQLLHFYSSSVSPLSNTILDVIKK